MLFGIGLGHRFGSAWSGRQGSACPVASPGPGLCGSTPGRRRSATRPLATSALPSAMRSRNQTAVHPSRTS